jgi:hypothetical protein
MCILLFFFFSLDFSLINVYLYIINFMAFDIWGKKRRKRRVEKKQEEIFIYMYI